MSIDVEGRSIARIRARRAAVVLFALEVALTRPMTGAEAQPGLDELLARVGDRIADLYKRAQHVICIETSRVQPIDLTYSSQGFARTVESELGVEADDGEAAGLVLAATG